MSIRVRPRSTEDALGSAFATMTSNLHDLIAQVQDNALQVASAAQQINAASEQTAQASQQVADTIQQVAQGTAQQSQAVTEATAQVDQMAQAIDGVAKGAQEQARAIERASASAAQMSTAMSRWPRAPRGRQASNEASTSARRGRHRVQTMEAIATIKSPLPTSAPVQRCSSTGRDRRHRQTIDDIAEADQPAGLNAAIGPRAGGRGAGLPSRRRVRKLAERSSGDQRDAISSAAYRRASKAVAQDRRWEVESGAELADFRRGARRHPLCFAAWYNQVQQIASAAQEMTAASSELVSAMDSVSAVVEENTAATEESAASTGEISAAMEHVASVSEENSAAAEEVSAMTEELNAQAEELTASAQSLAAMSEDLSTSSPASGLRTTGRGWPPLGRVDRSGQRPAPIRSRSVHGGRCTAEGNGRH